MLNIFTVIEKVTSRIEPFHSEFLAEVFRKHRSLLVGFLQQLQNQIPIDLTSLINADEVEVISEDSFDDNKRIDLVIHSEASYFVVGIEVKTNDSSVRDNQLDEYHVKLTHKYPDKRIILVYLTPFNKLNTPKDMDPNLIKANVEFSLFSIQHPLSIHLNWDQVIELYNDIDDYAGSILEAHSDFIQAKITNTNKLISRLNNIERNRGLSDFFGADCIGIFFDSLKEYNILHEESESSYSFTIPERESDIDNLLLVFRILIESDNLKKTVTRQDKVEKKLIQNYENSSNGNFFMSFFNLIHSYKYLWLEGKGSIGIRAAHESHPSSGVSLFTIDRNSITIHKTR